jgi:hypothetical protein
MKLFPTAESASKFIQLSWDKIEELDAGGRKVQSVNNFASQPFTITGPAEIEYDAGALGKFNATRVTLDATVTPTGAGAATAARFVVSVFAFRTDVTVPYGNTTVIVPRDNVRRQRGDSSAMGHLTAGQSSAEQCTNHFQPACGTCPHIPHCFALPVCLLPVCTSAAVVCS